MGKRRDLFPTDLALTLRMLLAAVLTPVVLIGALAVVVLWAPLRLQGGLALAAVLGVAAVVRERRDAVHGTEVSPAVAPELHAIVERLCLLADLPKPKLVVEPEAQPNSWVLSTGRDRTSLHLTRGLLDRLEPAQLE